LRKREAAVRRRTTALVCRHDPGALAHSPHHSAPYGRRQEHGTDGQAEIPGLDAEVLAERMASITAWPPLKTGPRQIVDPGCGTGAGTFALLDRFPDAHVTAVDASAGHLQSQ
jgi:methylase of polypeptide subunit release factors